MSPRLCLAEPGASERVDLTNRALLLDLGASWASEFMPGVELGAYRMGEESATY